MRHLKSLQATNIITDRRVGTELRQILPINRQHAKLFRPTSLRRFIDRRSIEIAFKPIRGPPESTCTSQIFYRLAPLDISEVRELI